MLSEKRTGELHVHENTTQPTQALNTKSECTKWHYVAMSTKDRLEDWESGCVEIQGLSTLVSITGRLRPPKKQFKK